MNVPLRVAEEDFFTVAGEMSRWLDRVLGADFHRYRDRESWSPAVNLYEDAAAYLMVVDLAGIDPKTIDLRVDKHQLVLRGQRPAPRPPERSECCLAESARVRMHLMEIDHGPFHRALEMPERVDTTAIKACYRNGFLWVKMPKGDGPK